jgi:hypothetical protein
LSGGQLWFQWGQTPCDQVGIHEMNDADFTQKKLFRERGFSSTIGTSDNNAARVLSRSVVHCTR